MAENEVRLWMRKIIEVLRTGAEITGTKVDDQACDMVLKAIDNDLLWSWLWKAIGRFFGGDSPIIVAQDPVPVSAGEIAEFNPLLVLSIIKALVDLWKLLRPQE